MALADAPVHLLCSSHDVLRTLRLIGRCEHGDDQLEDPAGRSGAVGGGVGR